MINKGDCFKQINQVQSTLIGSSFIFKLVADRRKQSNMSHLSHLTDFRNTEIQMKPFSIVQKYSQKIHFFWIHVIKCWYQFQEIVGSSYNIIEIILEATTSSCDLKHTVILNCGRIEQCNLCCSKNQMHALLFNSNTFSVAQCMHCICIYSMFMPILFTHCCVN